MALSEKTPRRAGQNKPDTYRTFAQRMLDVGFGPFTFRLLTYCNERSCVLPRYYTHEFGSYASTVLPVVEFERARPPCGGG